MNVRPLVLRDNLKILASYESLVHHFRGGLNKYFYKGYINNNEAQLFYYSGAFALPGSARIPLIQINAEDKIDGNGKICIRIKIVNLIIILFGIVNGIIALSSIFPDDKNRIPGIVPILTFALSYGFLLLRFLFERARIRHGLKLLEVTSR